MDKRKFGKSNISVSVLGYGAGHIGGENNSEKEVDYLLNSIVDSGINLIDTARGYNLSEERIGKYLSKRRSEIVISTKVGYGVEGHQDWTYSCIKAGVERALRILKTDYIDIVHLHSCPIETLKSGEVISALNDCKRDGKIVAAAYSGDNEPLEFAVESGAFDSIMCSINICDQRAIENSLKIAITKELGVIAKRPVANGAWRYKDRPYGNYAEVYWERFAAMKFGSFGMDWQEVALRFTAFLDGLHSCIVGTANMNHLKDNIAIVEKGKLPQDIIDTIRERFKESGKDWRGEI